MRSSSHKKQRESSGGSGGSRMVVDVDHGRGRMGASPLPAQPNHHYASIQGRKRFKEHVPTRPSVNTINEFLICQLCSGYLIDASAIIECQHTFCKSCILKYLENNEYCPVCDVELNKGKPYLSLRSDTTLQTLVYKLVPGLYLSEAKRRQEFDSANKNSKDNGIRSNEMIGAAGDAGSKKRSINIDNDHGDSVNNNNNNNNNVEGKGYGVEMVNFSEENLLYDKQNRASSVTELENSVGADLGFLLSKEEKVSLCLQYYKRSEKNNNIGSDKKIEGVKETVKKEKHEVEKHLRFSREEAPEERKGVGQEKPVNHELDELATDRRYLHCSAAVRVESLKRFIRMKYELSDSNKVELLYNGEVDQVLENDLTLLDVALIYRWNKESPMNIHYRIFEGVSTISSIGGEGVEAMSSLMNDEPPPPDDDASSSSSSGPQGTPAKVTRSAGRSSSAAGRAAPAASASAAKTSQIANADAAAAITSVATSTTTTISKGPVSSVISVAKSNGGGRRSRVINSSSSSNESSSENEGTVPAITPVNPSTGSKVKRQLRRGQPPTFNSRSSHVNDIIGNCSNSSDSNSAKLNAFDGKEIDKSGVSNAKMGGGEWVTGEKFTLASSKSNVGHRKRSSDVSTVGINTRQKVKSLEESRIGRSLSSDSSGALKKAMLSSTIDVGYRKGGCELSGGSKVPGKMSGSRNNGEVKKETMPAPKLDKDLHGLGGGKTSGTMEVVPSGRGKGVKGVTAAGLSGSSENASGISITLNKNAFNSSETGGVLHKASGNGSSTKSINTGLGNIQLPKSVSVSSVGINSSGGNGTGGPPSYSSYSNVKDISQILSPKAVSLLPKNTGIEIQPTKMPKSSGLESGLSQGANSNVNSSGISTTVPANRYTHPMLPESVHVPKSVTLIPVNPNGTIPNSNYVESAKSTGTTAPVSVISKSGDSSKAGSLTSTPFQSNKNSANPKPSAATTFTNPITNKNLHQITVTEVPPPGQTKLSDLGKATVSVENNNNSKVIGPKKSHNSGGGHNSLSNTQFNGPGSMQITKIWGLGQKDNVKGNSKGLLTRVGKKKKNKGIELHNVNNKDFGMAGTRSSEKESQGLTQRKILIGGNDSNTSGDASSADKGKGMVTAPTFNKMRSKLKGTTLNASLGGGGSASGASTSTKENFVSINAGKNMKVIDLPQDITSKPQIGENEKKSDIKSVACPKPVKSDMISGLESHTKSDPSSKGFSIGNAVGHSNIGKINSVKSLNFKPPSMTEALQAMFENKPLNSIRKSEPDVKERTEACSTAGMKRQAKTVLEIPKASMCMGISEPKKPKISKGSGGECPLDLSGKKEACDGSARTKGAGRFFSSSVKIDQHPAKPMGPPVSTSGMIPTLHTPLNKDRHDVISPPKAHQHGPGRQQLSQKTSPVPPPSVPPPTASLKSGGTPPSGSENNSILSIAHNLAQKQQMQQQLQQRHPQQPQPPQQRHSPQQQQRHSPQQQQRQSPQHQQRQSPQQQQPPQSSPKCNPPKSNLLSPTTTTVTTSPSANTSPIPVSLAMASPHQPFMPHDPFNASLNNLMTLSMTAAKLNKLPPPHVGFNLGSFGCHGPLGAGSNPALFPHHPHHNHASNFAAAAAAAAAAASKSPTALDAETAWNSALAAINEKFAARFGNPTLSPTLPPAYGISHPPSLRIPITSSKSLSYPVSTSSTVKGATSPTCEKVVSSSALASVPTIPSTFGGKKTINNNVGNCPSLLTKESKKSPISNITSVPSAPGSISSSFNLLPPGMHNPLRSKASSTSNSMIPSGSAVSSMANKNVIPSSMRISNFLPAVSSATLNGLASFNKSSFGPMSTDAKVASAAAKVSSARNTFPYPTETESSIFNQKLNFSNGSTALGKSYVGPTSEATHISVKEERAKSPKRCKTSPDKFSAKESYMSSAGKGKFSYSNSSFSFSNDIAKESKKEGSKESHISTSHRLNDPTASSLNPSPSSIHFPFPGVSVPFQVESFCRENNFLGDTKSGGLGNVQVTPTLNRTGLLPDKPSKEKSDEDCGDIDVLTVPTESPLIRKKENGKKEIELVPICSNECDDPSAGAKTDESKPKPEVVVSSASKEPEEDMKIACEEKPKLEDLETISVSAELPVESTATALQDLKPEIRCIEHKAVQEKKPTDPHVLDVADAQPTEEPPMKKAKICENGTEEGDVGKDEENIIDTKTGTEGECKQSQIPLQDIFAPKADDASNSKMEEDKVPKEENGKRLEEFTNFDTDEQSQSSLIIVEEEEDEEIDVEDEAEEEKKSITVEDAAPEEMEVSKQECNEPCEVIAESKEALPEEPMEIDVEEVEEKDVVDVNEDGLQKIEEDATPLEKAKEMKEDELKEPKEKIVEAEQEKTAELEEMKQDSEVNAASPAVEGSNDCIEVETENTKDEEAEALKDSFETVEDSCLKPAPENFKNEEAEEPKEDKTEVTVESVEENVAKEGKCEQVDDTAEVGCQEVDVEVSSSEPEHHENFEDKDVEIKPSGEKDNTVSITALSPEQEEKTLKEKVDDDVETESTTSGVAFPSDAASPGVVSTPEATETVASIEIKVEDKVDNDKSMVQSKLENISFSISPSTGMIIQSGGCASDVTTSVIPTTNTTSDTSPITNANV